MIGFIIGFVAGFAACWMLGVIIVVRSLGVRARAREIQGR